MGGGSGVRGRAYGSPWREEVHGVVVILPGVDDCLDAV